MTAVLEGSRSPLRAADVEPAIENAARAHARMPAR